MRPVATRALSAATALAFGMGVALPAHDAMAGLPSTCVTTPNVNMCQNTSGLFHATTSVPETDTPAQVETACYNAILTANSLFLNSCATNGGTLTNNITDSPGSFYQPSTIPAITITCNGTFACISGIWVTNVGSHQVMKFDSSSGTFVSSFGTQGSSDGLFMYPYGIALDSAGNIWVADYGNQNVQEFTSSGTLVQVIPSGCPGIPPSDCASGSGPGQFSFPYDIAIDSGNNIWVTDYSNNRVQEFSISGNTHAFLRGIGAGYNGVSGSIGSPGFLDGQFDGPRGITIDSGNNVWVTDEGNNRVQEFTSSGVWERTSPSGCPDTAIPGCAPGSNPNQLDSPQAIASDGSGDVWVADYNNNRMVEIDGAGNYLGQFGSSGSGPGQFSQISGIAVDPIGNIWVTDIGNNRTQEFDSGGNYLGQFSTSYPKGIAIH